MSMHRVKMINEYNRQEFKDYLVLNKQFENLEDVDVHNPIIQKAAHEMEEEYKKIAPLAQEVTRKYEEEFLKKRARIKTALRDQFNSAMEEINNPTSKLTPLKKEKTHKHKNVKRKKELAKSKQAKLDKNK